MGSAFSAASIFETYRPRESENWWQICRPLNLWIVSIVATTGISVPMYTVGDFVLTEGSFGYDTQVSDPGISQLQRWLHAARLTKHDVGLGLSTDLPDTLNDNVTWRRVALIYQLPGQDAVSDVGLQRAKAVEDSLRSLGGWQRLCGEMPASYQGLCREGDSLVSASFAMRAQVSASQVALGVSAELALNANSSQASIKMETLARIMEEQAPGTLDRWLPKDEFGMHSYFAFRSSFSFALRVDSAAASWAELILEEVEPLLLDLGVLSVAREEQDDLRVYLEADNLPQIQANELRRSMSEDLPLLVFGPLSAFLALLLRGRLLVALTAAVLAFAVPVIASLGILGRRDELLEGVEVRIVATAAWFVVAAGVADLSAACAHAMEERRESLRLMAPQWLLVRLLSQSAEQLQAASPPSLWRQVMACMPLEELRGHSAQILKVVRFVIEALLPTAVAGLMLLLLSMQESLELVANFGAHAGMGLILCAPLTAFMVPVAVEAGDAIAARVQAWREASDLELSDALQTVFDNTFPFEFGAKQDLAMDLKLKMRKRMRDYLRVRWSLIGVSFILGGLVLAYIVTFLLRDAANFTAQTPQLFEELKKLGTDRKAVVMNPAKMQRNMSMLRTASQMTVGGSDGQDAQDFGPIERKQLKTLGILGCGGFGFVELVEHALTGETYALKAISKGYIVKSGMKNSVLQEKAVHMQCDSLFIVRLFETYNSPDMLYFLMEAALGGELYATYNRKGFFGKDNFAKFYVAGVVLAFDHLHGKKIIYRDLKPENLLLNERGCIKLTDMGLAKICVGKTYTACGTPDYFAPELIASTGHTNAVDWWTLGIFLFELLSGHPPFESSYPMQTYQNHARHREGGVPAQVQRIWSRASASTSLRSGFP